MNVDETDRMKRSITLGLKVTLGLRALGLAAFGLAASGLLGGMAASAAFAQEEPAPAARVVGTGLHELSPWSMFLSADIVVKVVMVGLALASFATWTVFIAKSIELVRARRRLSANLRKIDNARTLREAREIVGDGRGVLARFLEAAAHEEHLSTGHAGDASLMDRAGSRFSEIVRAEQRAVRRGLGILATIGSTAPFVGLFGTVWGIMNSFIGISRSQTTNLAVVAPGIAEALLATAVGLVAAIPAVIIYNHFARSTGAYLDTVNRASGAAARLLSRDLDRGPARTLARAAE